jgi:hypothetical protein
MAGAVMAPSKLLLASTGAGLLAGCSATAPLSVPTSYYYPPAAYQWQAPSAYAPPLQYNEAVPPPRYVRPAPPVSRIPDQADLAPHPRRAPPSFEEGDPCVGWWRICTLWAGT